jgi:uncharacterized cupredoxin-like copper-binding protein
MKKMRDIIPIAGGRIVSNAKNASWQLGHEFMVKIHSEILELHFTSITSSPKYGF